MARTRTTRRRTARRLRLGLPVLALVVASLPLALANEARTPAETFERKGRIADCLVYVAKDLAARAARTGTSDPPLLLLVLDTTSSMANELTAIKGALDEAWTEGHSALRIGVLGIRTENYLPPTRIASRVGGMIDQLAFTPVDGPRNVYAAVRDAVVRLNAEAGDGPRALLLVSEEGGDTEEDVEATRDVLIESGAAFYCVAGEAAFEHPWIQPFQPRDHTSLGLRERYDPAPRKIAPGELFYGSEVAFPLVPYAWEAALAQTVFHWVAPPAYPVPSGFGYWGLASLAFTTGGRYFVFDFPAKELPKLTAARRKLTYDAGRLALLAPDLRPRAQVLKAWRKDARVTTIVRIWEHLANEAMPIVQEIGCLERRGGLTSRPTRSIAAAPPFSVRFESLDEVKKARRAATDRIAAIDQALSWWQATAGRAVTGSNGGADAHDARLDADFHLLGVQLKKMRFSFGEALAALQSIQPLDVTYRRAHLQHRVLFSGATAPKPLPDLKDDERNARLADYVLAQNMVVERYEGTPFALMLQRGWTLTFEKAVEILEPEPKRPAPSNGDKAPPPQPAPPPTPPRAPPPDGPRPGSGSGGPTTGGG